MKTNTTCLKVLIAAPVHQDNARLKKYLESLANLNTDGLEIHYLFIDDNTDFASRTTLLDFSRTQQNVNILIADRKALTGRGDDSFTHQWSANLIHKMVYFRNLLLDFARTHDYDYLFTIDSDILLHKNTLVHLIQQQKDIICEIFWTRWTPNSMEMPQVWLSDKYTLFDAKWCETPPSDQEQTRQMFLFLNMLRNPGVYPVGGLGACTLIAKNVLQSAISYHKIPNVSFWGEDRHFCIRAAVLGFGLFVDTHYPAFHIYRVENLPEAEEFARTNQYAPLVWNESDPEFHTEQSLVAAEFLATLSKMQKNSEAFGQQMQLLTYNLTSCGIAYEDLWNYIRKSDLDLFLSYGHLGLAYYYTGQKETALKWFQAANQINPEDEHIINNIRQITDELCN